MELKQKTIVKSLVKNSHSKMAAVKTFMDKFKTSSSPKHDAASGADNSSELSVEHQESIVSSDAHSISSQSSHQFSVNDPLPPLPPGAPLSTHSLQNIPRHRASAAPDVRPKSQSLGPHNSSLTAVPPPLPPRSTQSQF